MDLFESIKNLNSVNDDINESKEPKKEDPYKSIRRDWGDVNPVTKVYKDKSKYDRKDKHKKDLRYENESLDSVDEDTFSEVEKNSKTESLNESRCVPDDSLIRKMYELACIHDPYDFANDVSFEEFKSNIEDYFDPEECIEQTIDLRDNFLNDDEELVALANDIIDGLESLKNCLNEDTVKQGNSDEEKELNLLTGLVGEKLAKEIINFYNSLDQYRFSDLDFEEMYSDDTTKEDLIYSLEETKKELEDDEEIKNAEQLISSIRALCEDTVKQGNYWVNKGDSGKTHGKFKTKKEADAQRRAMGASGFFEGIDGSGKRYRVETIKVDDSEEVLNGQQPASEKEKFLSEDESTRRWGADEFIEWLRLGRKFV